MGKVSQATGVPLSFLLVQSRMRSRSLASPARAGREGQRRRRARSIPQVAARPGGMLLGAASYHPLHASAHLPSRSRTRCRSTSSLAELRKPEVKAAILAENDLPADPHRQFESLGRQHAVHVRAASSRSATRRTTSRLPTVDRRARRRDAAVTRGRCSTTTSPRATLLLGAFTNYAQGAQDHLARDDQRSEHRHRPLRRWRPREDDLRRLDADVPADALGRATARAVQRLPLETVIAQAGRRHRRCRGACTTAARSRWARRPTST